MSYAKYLTSGGAFEFSVKGDHAEGIFEINTGPIKRMIAIEGTSFYVNLSTLERFRGHGLLPGRTSTIRLPEILNASYGDIIVLFDQLTYQGIGHSDEDSFLLYYQADQPTLGSSVATTTYLLEKIFLLARPPEASAFVCNSFDGIPA